MEAKTPQMIVKQKKNIKVDAILWQQIKGRLTMQGKTVSQWFEEMARKELYPTYE